MYNKNSFIKKSEREREKERVVQVNGVSWNEANILDFISLREGWGER